MLTIEALKSFGADADEGLKRCVNNEEFYFKMIGKAVNEPSFDMLYSALDEKDYDMAFEKAHALKGVLGNLALTPIYDPMSEMVELLRGRTDTDYSKYIETIKEKKKELEALL